jgi:hypothetical protein
MSRSRASISRGRASSLGGVGDVGDDGGGPALEATSAYEQARDRRDSAISRKAVESELRAEAVEMERKKSIEDAHPNKIAREESVDELQPTNLVSV